jgi:hypothetical protein
MDIIEKLTAIACVMVPVSLWLAVCIRGHQG